LNNAILFTRKMREIERIKEELEPLRQELLNHRVYQEINSIENLNTFLQHHVFAVWNFMSLVKYLQIKLTCISVPWLPQSNPTIAKLINEIVLAEETDIDGSGNPISHFELYLDAMKASSASTEEIEKLLTFLGNGETVENALICSTIPESVKKFVQFDFDIIETEETHKVAAAFAFGREDLIPDMFRSLIGDLNKKFPDDLNKLIYYLDRHIELDEDVHGPMAMKMIEDLCQNNPKKWEDCLIVSKEALLTRIALWDGISEEINATSAERSSKNAFDNVC